MNKCWYIAVSIWGCLCSSLQAAPYPGKLYYPPKGIQSFAWSVDGKYVAYEDLGLGGEGKRRLVLLELSTGKSRDVNVPDSYSMPIKDIQFSPDGNQLCVKVNAAVDIYDLSSDVIAKKQEPNPAGASNSRRSSFISTCEWLSGNKVLSVNGLENAYISHEYYPAVLLSPNKKTVLYGFPRSTGNTYKDSRGAGLIYSVSKSKEILRSKEISSPQWDGDGNAVLYLKHAGEVLEVRGLSLSDPADDRKIAGVDIHDASEYSSWGASMVRLPVSGKLLIGLHLSSVVDRLDGWGYENKGLDEIFRFYLVDSVSGGVEILATIKYKGPTSPPIPNIIMQANPTKDLVLAQIHPEGFYMVDAEHKTCEKIAIQLTNLSALSDLDRSQLGAYGMRSGIIEPKSGEMSSVPKAARWSSDGAQLGFKFGGFISIDMKSQVPGKTP